MTKPAPMKSRGRAFPYQFSGSSARGDFREPKTATRCAVLEYRVLQLQLRRHMPDLDTLRRLSRSLSTADGSDPHDVSAIVDAIGDARIVLLGEASHGTHEFYATRAAVTRRLT